MVVLSSNADIGENYLLHATGYAQISLTASGGKVLNKTYDRSTNTVSAIISIPQVSTSMVLSFRNTTGPVSTDLVVFQRGYNRFSDLSVVHLSRFNLLHFMDWTETNHNFETHWNEKLPVEWLQYTPLRRNPWKTIPDLLN